MNPPCDPNVPFPEIRELVRLARAYLAGDVNYSYVCCAAVRFYDAARLFSPDRSIRQMAEKWMEMATRVWPEMARIDNPITEEEFKQWVRGQLAVFESVQGRGALQFDYSVFNVSAS